MTTKPLALIAAGGTGGHIIPGLAIAEALLSKGWEVRWVGSPDAMEGRLVPAHGITLEPLVFAGFRGKSIAHQLLMPLKILTAFWKSIKILRRTKPQILLGMGGYVAFPVGMMASLLNVPLVVHEQNSVAGLTNRILAKLADKVLTAFPNALPGSTWVGNPVRREIIQSTSPAIRWEGRQGPLRLLVAGGSLGATALNTLVPEALAKLDPASRPQVTHQSGERHLADLKRNYDQAGVQADCTAFIEDMASALAQADIVICRAGAMTVSEVACVGAAALFVPFPHAVDDHQTANARFLVDADAAWMQQQAGLTADELAGWFKTLSREACLNKAEKARQLAKPDATEQVVRIMEQLGSKK